MSTRCYPVWAVSAFLFLLLPACVHVVWAELLVSSHDTDEVMRYRETDGTYIDTFVSAGSGMLDAPHELLFGHDKHLLVCSALTDSILRYDGIHGAFMDAFVIAGSGGLDYPASMTFGPDGHLYVSSQLSDQVLRYNGTDGSFIDIFVDAGSGGLSGPSDLTFAPDGDLYVTGRFSNRAYKYDGSSGAFLDVFAQDSVSQPFGIAFGPDGNIYISSGNDGSVYQYDATSLDLLGTFVMGLGFPVELEFGPDTNLYVAAFGSNRVRRFNGGTGTLIDTLVMEMSGGLDGPNFMTFRPDLPSDPGCVFFVQNAPDQHDYGRQTNLPPQFGTGEFTMELWIRPDNTFAIGPTFEDTPEQLIHWLDADVMPYSSGSWWFAGNFLLDGHNNGGGGFHHGTFSLQFYGGGRVRWDFGDGSIAGQGGHYAVQAFPATNAPSLLDGEWHQITCVRRWTGISEALLELYSDGVFVASQTSNVRTDMQATYWSTWADFPAGQEGWFWGAEKQAALVGGLSQYEDYKGCLDEIRFWSRAKSAEEIAVGGRNPVDGSEEGLEGWYRFSEGVDFLARDALNTNGVIQFVVPPTNLWSNENAPFDHDGDQLPDWWESRFFGDATNALPGSDGDNDGLNHLEEYGLRTDPTNADSALAFTSTQVMSANGIVDWTTVGGRRYRVEYSDDPLAVGGFQELIRTWAEETEQDVALDGEGIESFTDDFSLTGGAPTNGIRLYRIRQQ